jgi:hypothetical protein
MTWRLLNIFVLKFHETEEYCRSKNALYAQNTKPCIKILSKLISQNLTIVGNLTCCVKQPKTVNKAQHFTLYIFCPS